MKRLVIACALAVLTVPAAAHGQKAPRPSAEAASDDGIPVDNPLVRSRCGGCHRARERRRTASGDELQGEVRRARVPEILRRVVSADGRTMTSQVVDVDANGQETVGSTLVFDKQ